MNAKLHINLSQGILEVEGDPDFVREMYSDFKIELHQLSIKSNALPASKNDNPKLSAIQEQDVIQVEAGQPAEKPAKKKAASGKKESYSLIKDLNTGMPEEKDSIFSYLDRYKPKSNIDTNVVIIKYLQDRHANLTVGLDHIYTCYSNAGLDLPKALHASIVDTGRADKGYGYIDCSSMNDIKVVLKGEILLQGLEKKANEKKK